MPDEPERVDLPPGYFVEPETGAWLTLRWPDDPAELPPSLAPQIVAWVQGRATATTPALEGPRLLHHLTGQPWSYTLGQLKFLWWWYAANPSLRWLFRSSVKRRAKGAGKDPFGGSLTIVEAGGPVVPDGFDSHGNLVGRLHRMALVQIGANSEAQAGDMLRVANGMISPYLADEMGADPGVLRTLLGSSRIELLTSSEASSEGDPVTAVFLNETHHMSHSNGGQRLAGVARRNAGKSPGGLARVMSLTNAHSPGGGSVGEEDYAAWQAQVAGKTRRQDILYDSREAAANLRLHIEEELELGIHQAYADSPWVDEERIRDEAQDPRVPAADSIRFYFNGLPTNELAWVEPRNYDAGTRHLDIVDGDPVVIFLDCSKSEDATALRLARVTDRYAFGDPAWIWRRPHGDRGKGWLAPRDEVDAVVRMLWDRYAVQMFGVDPSPALDDETEALYWGPTIDAWERDYRQRVLIWATPSGVAKSPVRFDMRMSVAGGVERNRMFTESAMRVAAAIDDEGTFIHDGCPITRSHVHNARRRPNQFGVSLGKVTRDSKQLVDGAVAMVGADMLCQVVQQSGKRLRHRPTSDGGRIVVLR